MEKPQPLQVDEKMKEKLLKTEEGIALFRRMLKEAGFNPKKPDFKTAWSVFKAFGNSRFECADDSLLFEAGVYVFDDEEQFCLSMVRQFTIEVEQEYDYIEQIHLDLFYRPDERLTSLKETIWTYDFGDEAAAFYEAVEKNAVFALFSREYEALGCEIYQDEV